MAHYNPSIWRKVKPKQKMVIPNGMFQMLASEEVQIFCATDDGETPLGKVSKLKKRIPEGAEVWFEGSPSALVSFYDPFLGEKNPKKVKRAEGVFTNTDKRPVLSGSLAEVINAGRQLKIQAQRSLSELNKATKRAETARDKIAPPKPPEKKVEKIEEPLDDGQNSD